ncbi:MAG: sulfite exporter TauE/SafE family protein [Thermoanaerobaculales bacterium]|nr:sulfite exporter TauE/SafE family protein [Thermoanaerobaculales bacterium]
MPRCSLFSLLLRQHGFEVGNVQVGAFVITAAGTASPQGGLAVMAAFWAGTVPILLAIGFGAQAMALPFRRHAPMVTAILLVAIGVVAIVRRPDTTVSILPKIQNNGVTAEERIKNLDSGQMPCYEEEQSEESPAVSPEDQR